MAESYNYYVGDLPMHIPDGSPASLSAIYTVAKEALTDNVGEYIGALRDQHILLFYAKDKVEFTIDSLVAMRSFSNLTPITGTCFKSVEYLSY